MPWCGARGGSGGRGRRAVRLLPLVLARAIAPAATGAGGAPDDAPICIPSGAARADVRPVLEDDPASAPWVAEAERLNRCMGTHSRLCSSASLFNARADPERDSVILGQPLVEHARRLGTDAVRLGIGFILAHEYGHAFQFRMVERRLEELRGDRLRTELQADVLAGYWAGARIREEREQAGESRAWELRAGEKFLRYAASTGDYAYNNPTHHGTPAQRGAATRAGFDAGHAGRFGPLDRAYSSSGDYIYAWSRTQAARVAAGP